MTTTNTQTILQVCTEFQRKKGITTGKKHAERLGIFTNHLAAFIRFQYGVNDLEITEIKFRFIDDFFMYCMTEKTYKCSYTRKLITFLKSVMDFAILHEYTQVNNIRSYKPLTYGKERELLYLNNEQLNKLYLHRFSTRRLQRIQDFFLFQCFTGLSYCDLASLCNEHIVRENGKLWIMKKRQKTGIISSIPLVKEAEEILNRLALKKRSPAPDQKIFKCICNQTYNKYLKELGILLKLPFPLTTHVARKTFATTALNKGNVSIETVAKMLGHSNTLITQRIYSKVLNTRIDREMEGFSFVSGS